MSSLVKPIIRVAAIARELDGFHKRRLVRVDLEISPSERPLPTRVSIWFTEAEIVNFSAAEDMARSELHRISEFLASAKPSDPELQSGDQPASARPPAPRRKRQSKWLNPQKTKGFLDPKK